MDYADFVYIRDGSQGGRGCEVRPDQEFIIKRKLMLFIHGFA